MNGSLREHDIWIYIPWGNLDLYWYFYEWFPQGTWHFNLHSLRKPRLILILLWMVPSGNMTCQFTFPEEIWNYIHTTMNGCLRKHDMSMTFPEETWTYIEWLPQDIWTINLYSLRKHGLIIILLWMGASGNMKYKLIFPEETIHSRIYMNIIPCFLRECKLKCYVPWGNHS